MVIALILVYSGYYHLTGVINHANKITFDRIINDTATCLENDFNKISAEINLLSQTLLTKTEINSSQAEKILLLKTALDENASVNAVYTGYNNGSLLLVRRLTSFSGYSKYDPPLDAYYVVTIATPKNNTEGGAELTFFDRSFKKLLQVYDRNYDYNATTRIWYKQAIKTPTVITSPPYVFYSTREIGITIAKSNTSTNNVIGFDYTMDSLLKIVKEYSLSDETRTILYNSQGQILTANYEDKIIHLNNGDYSIVTVDNIIDPVINDYAKNIKSSENVAFVSGKQKWVGERKSFKLQDNTEEYTVLTVTPEHTLMEKATDFKQDILITGVILILIILPVIWLIAFIIARPLTYLSQQLDRIKNFDFNSPINIKSSVVEIDNLINSSKSMMTTIKNFQTIAETITKQQEYEILLNTVLKESTSIINGKGGAVYLFSNDDAHLEISALYLNESSIAEQNRIFSKVKDAGDISRKDFEKYFKTETDFYIEKRGESYINNDILIWPALIGETDLHMSIIRLKDIDGNMMGYIVFAHDRRNYSTSNESEFSFIKALSGFVSAAIESQLLIKKRKELLQSLIVLIADAIDAKSPYTGKHCHRVPVITRMIVEEVCNSTSPEYNDYKLNSDEWEEIRIASWLHDCGKVITPVDVVDKATKLECIYNRIHEVRMRFELLKSYAERDYWKKLYNGENAEQLRQELDNNLKELDDEFAFIAQCNIGGEFMSDEAIERLNKISKRTWIRTIDNTLGLADVELSQYEHNMPAASLPVKEKLLDDKPEHIIKRNLNHISDDFDFTMSEPENKRNMGELYNLRIRRGTLSDEDRYIINSHITHTIRMLSTLPFPKHMNNIVEIAGNHHERMEGGGYPRGIKTKELSITARAIAVADIFEALTAHDRPYKKPKTLNEALKIMKYMVNDKHIDKGLFELFITSGSAEKYASEYLLKEQQDKINYADFLS